MSLGANNYEALTNGPNITPAGETLRALGWVVPDLAMDMYQVPELHGQTEYLRLRSGQRVVGRVWRNGN